MRKENEMNRKFFIAGVQFRPSDEIRKVKELIKNKDYLKLVPEPSNKFDPNAIKIEYDLKTDKGIVSIHLGYVPKKFSSEVAGLLEHGIELVCNVEEINPDAKPWELFQVVIRENY